MIWDTLDPLQKRQYGVLLGALHLPERFDDLSRKLFKDQAALALYDTALEIRKLPDGDNKLKQKEAFNERLKEKYWETDRDLFNHILAVLNQGTVTVYEDVDYLTWKRELDEQLHKRRLGFRLDDITRAREEGRDEDAVRYAKDVVTLNEDGPSGLSKGRLGDRLSEVVLSSSDLTDLVIPPRKRLLGDWLCRGDLGFVYAPRGVGKTWFSLGLAHAIAAGGSFGPWNGGEGARTLYVDGEMPLELSKERNEALNQDGDLTWLHHEQLYLKLEEVINLSLPQWQEAITQMVLDEGMEVVVLDNLSCLISGVRENAGEDWEQLAPWLLHLRRIGVTVIMVHHAGRSGKMRGHTKKEDQASWIISLEDTKDGGEAGARFVVHFSKPSRNTPDGVPDTGWSFVTEDGALSVSHQAAETIDRVVALVNDGYTSCTEIAEALDKSKGTISKVAKRAERQGLICVNGNRYEPSNVRSFPRVSS